VIDSFVVHTKTLNLASWSWMVFKMRTVRRSSTQNHKREFDRAVRSSSRVKGQFKCRSSSS
jgi:hypothetical protein